MSLKYGYVDIKLDTNPDDIMDNDITFEDGDFALCANENAFAQHMRMRILTNPNEMPMHQNIGAGIEELEGMPNTRDTGSFGETKIMKSISADNDIDTSQIIVRAVPTDKDEITFYTYADIENGRYTQRQFVTASFKLNHGLLVMDKTKK